MTASDAKDASDAGGRADTPTGWMRQLEIEIFSIGSWFIIIILMEPRESYVHCFHHPRL